MRTALLAVAMLLGTAAAVLGFTLWKNGLPWDLPPGTMTRLVTYVTTHVADTAENSIFPELRPRVYAGVPAEELYTAVDQAVGKLGWAVSQRDRSAHVVRAVITTRLMQFQDDIEIAAVDVGHGGSRLMVRAVSRTGQGDLGTNTAHILALYRMLDTALPPPPDAARTAVAR